MFQANMHFVFICTSIYYLFIASYDRFFRKSVNGRKSKLFCRKKSVQFLNDLFLIFSKTFQFLRCERRRNKRRHAYVRTAGRQHISVQSITVTHESLSVHQLRFSHHGHMCSQHFLTLVWCVYMFVVCVARPGRCTRGVCRSRVCVCRPPIRSVATPK